MSEKAIQVCTRCVMDNESDATISFLEDGTCNYCNDVLSRCSQEYFPNEEGKRQLDSIMERIKQDGKTKEYDCMVGVSGGVDSSYILYLGYQYGLRMLAVHIDDGLDTKVAKKNIESLCEKTKTKLLSISPDREQYADILLAFFKAAVPSIPIPQDNLLLAALHETAKKYKITYSLSGGNFALESILQRGCSLNACDLKHIRAIHRRFGTKPIDRLSFTSMLRFYIGQRYFSPVKKIYPLNYLDYNLERVLEELKEFCGYNYYGGKHYESVLTRFVQCYYLPQKYRFDKRKSHFSSMILSDQMTRDEALQRLSQPPYTSEELFREDFTFLANYFHISEAEFKKILALPPKQHEDYPTSALNVFAPIARKFRKFLG